MMKLQAKTKHIPQSLEELFAHDELGAFGRCAACPKES